MWHLAVMMSSLLYFGFKYVDVHPAERTFPWSAFCLFITFPQQNNGLPFCQIVTVNRNRNLCFPETKFNIFFAEVDWHRVTSIVLLFLENLETIDAERYCQEIDEIWPEIRLIRGPAFDRRSGPDSNAFPRGLLQLSQITV